MQFWQVNANVINNFGDKMPTLPFMCKKIAKANKKTRIFSLRNNPTPTGKEILDNFHKCGDWPIIPVLYEKAKKILRDEKNL